MYPEEFWGKISDEAVSFIQQFLKVDLEKRYSFYWRSNANFLPCYLKTLFWLISFDRYTGEMALQDPWVKDLQCYKDIIQLETEARNF